MWLKPWKRKSLHPESGSSQDVAQGPQESDLGGPAPPEGESAAGVQPQLIQGIWRRDGVGEGQETTA